MLIDLSFIPNLQIRLVCGYCLLFNGFGYTYNLGNMTITAFDLFYWVNKVLIRYFLSGVIEAVPKHVLTYENESFLSFLLFPLFLTFMV